MLQQIQGVRQDGNERERHWFQDDYFDLFVWTDAAGHVAAEFAARSASLNRRMREFIGNKIAHAPASLSAPAGAP